MKANIIVAALILAFFTLFIRITFALEERSCNMIEANGGPASEWKGKFNGGCYVQVNDQWIPRDNWRGEYQQ